MDLSPQAWTAIWATALFIAALALLCFAPPLIERLRARQYEAWSRRCAEDEKQWWLLHRIEEDAKRLEKKGRVA